MRLIIIQFNLRLHRKASSGASNCRLASFNSPQIRAFKANVRHCGPLAHRKARDNDEDQIL